MCITKQRLTDTFRSIVGVVKCRSSAINISSIIFSDPSIDPFEILSMLGIERDLAELYEVTVENIGYFESAINDFINPRVPPTVGDKVYLAPSEMLKEMISPKDIGETGGAHIGSLLTREEDEVSYYPLCKRACFNSSCNTCFNRCRKSYTAGVLIEELMRPYNRAAVFGSRSSRRI
jgi:DNA helicase HerA-like ATPase